MRKIKIFNATNPDWMEQQVNDWLKEHQTVIFFNVLQNQSECQTEDGLSWSLTITIFYYEGEQGT